jgi:SAM-dependent methyltransferase
VKTTVTDAPVEYAAIQAEHYDRLIENYEAHTTERSSLAYRRRFIDEPLLRGLDLQGREVLEAMCGSGLSTGYLLERGAQVTGLDVSPEAIRLFRSKWPECEASAESLLDFSAPDESFDVVVVVGGLHHVQPGAEEAIEQIWRLLRPGGYFCFCEPHSRSFIEPLRKAWYRRDPMFEENEAAIDVEALKARFADRYRFVTEHYFGNVAHVLVLNSLVMRVPPSVKRLYATPAIWIERFLNPLLGRRLSCSVTCQWQKR